MSNLQDMLDYARKEGTQVITTVEAFHKEPKLLYDFLRYAANHGIDVHMAHIITTDQSKIKLED